MREFRRATVAMALLALACAPKLREPGPALARTARVQLTPASADVWASSIRVTASAEGGSELARCAVVGGSGERELARSGSGFSASVALAPGQNSFFARCDDGRGHRVRSEPVVYTVPLTTNPVARIRARMHGEQLVLDGAPSASNEFSAAPLRKFSWSRQGARDRAPAASSAGPELRPTALPGDSDVIYELSVEDAMGRTDVARTQVRVRSGRFELPRPAPLWLDDAVVYGVIPPLYGTEPLKGVRRALRPLAELGVSAIWLSPIFTTPEGDFGYAVKDYFSVRADYGTEQDLKDLADEAHALGLRVLLDFVPNHTSTEHRYFEQARELGNRSHYFTFYERGPGGSPTHYFDWEHLPNLAHSNPEVARWMTASAAHWLTQAGIDGYRVDAAWGIRQRRPEYYDGLVDELRRIRPDVLLIAEASARDDFYLAHGFDAAYDWTHELGKWAWNGVFGERTGIARRLDTALQQTRATAAREDRVFRFLNNNDTGARFVTRHGIALTRAATVLLMTLPGIPCLYAFDEIGGEFEPYAELQPLTTGAHPELRAFHRDLIHLRRTQPALRSATMRTLAVGSDDEVFAYVRHPAGDGPPLLVLLNFGERPASLLLEADAAAKLGRDWKPLFGSGVKKSEQRSLRFELGGFGYGVFVGRSEQAAGTASSR